MHISSHAVNFVLWCKGIKNKTFLLLKVSRLRQITETHYSTTALHFINYICQAGQSIPDLYDLGHAPAWETFNLQGQGQVSSFGSVL